MTIQHLRSQERQLHYGNLAANYPRPRKSVEVETRPRKSGPSSGLKTRTSLEYYSATFSFDNYSFFHSCIKCMEILIADVTPVANSHMNVTLFWYQSGRGDFLSKLAHLFVATLRLLT